uniref:B-related factor 1 n=1 Tax=Acrobeloides nanus TaxID=290746 RepID=A0A914EM23_9BILA
MSGTCQNCGSSEIEEDNGSIICTSCGTVLAESTITNDVAFEETRGGGAQAVGTFVKQGNSAENVSGIRGVNRTESSEQTFLKGKKVIQEIASQLRINQHCIDTAFNWFKMCVTRNFTRGRPRSHVAAACLYMTCRRQNTPHMLLDFSDVTQVNVYDLGRALNFLTRSLKINLPTTDPCLYILRFAVMLDLGEKQKDVVDLATRIVNRMKRDWLGMGRRPTGLCGAALLLAARAHNYNRSISDIVRVVHISESVIRKRLDEFASTPSGSELSIEEFNNVDLEHNEDPPAYQEAKKKIKEAQENSQLDEMTKQLEPVQREIEDELKKRLKSHPFAKMIVNIADDDVPELCNAADLIRSEVLESVYEEIEETTSNDESLVQVAPGPSLQSLGIIPGIRTTQSTFVKPWNMERHDGALDLTDIDDMEIESYLLTDSESKLKERMWMARNSHHLEEMER